MSDDRDNTPLPACYHHGAITAQLQDHDRRIAHNHRTVARLANERVGANERRLVAIAGEDGKNGRIGDMRTDIDENKKAIAEQRRELTKVKIAAAGAAAIGSGIATAIAQLTNYL